MNSQLILSVSQLNTYVKSVLDGDPALNCVYLCGEISNFNNHYRTGHLYFSLKDTAAAVKAVMFKGSASRLKFMPEDGMRVIARGRVSVFEAAGQYQLYVDDMQPDGAGALSVAFEQLKNRLAKEGLFDAVRKKPIPKYPQRVGVITSPTGAAVQDILNILGRRFPLAEVVFAPVTVQGTGAAYELADAVKRFNHSENSADVLIIGRGGGSAEDLWAFNDENLARTIAESKIPVISAVGHETDFTICDFVSDLRAPTPSAAAELAVPDKLEQYGNLDKLYAAMYTSVLSKLSAEKLRQKRIATSAVFQNPISYIDNKRMIVDALTSRALFGFEKRMSAEKLRFTEAVSKLEAYSPLKALSRGYAMVTQADGGVIREADSVRVGDTVRIVLSDGEMDASVLKIRKGQEQL